MTSPASAADDAGVASSSISVFLSHRYRSPEINLYFHDVCSRTAEVQFEVDEGASPISVARLARLVRGADAFIGIYPFPADAGTQVRRSDLLGASRYFRLELDLAARAGVPMLVFYDQRYRSVLALPHLAHQMSFDAAEIRSPGGIPSEPRHARAFEDFHRVVRARRDYQAEVGQRLERTAVGLLLPPDDYDERVVAALADRQASRGYTPVVMPWPLSAGGRSTELAATCDWIVFDPGDSPEGGVALGWLDGQAVPLVRLRRERDGRSPVPAAEESLYRNVEVGYSEDRLTWRTGDDLLEKFDDAIDLVLAPTRRISTRTQAQEYFRSAGRRPEKVFLSYASEDAHVARPLAAQLTRKFDTVFDYQHEEALSAGSSYPDQLYDRLAKADIGVPLLSASYLSKATCRHEAQDMAASLDAQRMFVYPLNLDGCKPPSYFRSVQFQRISLSDFDAELCVERLVRAYDQRHGAAD